MQIWTKSEGDVSLDVFQYAIKLTAFFMQFVPSLSLAGHEDWVKSLVFRAPENAGDALVLASGSQDATIRLWNIEPHARKQALTTSASVDPLSDDLLDAFEASLGDLDDSEEGGRQISLKRHMLSVKTPTGR